VEKFRAKNALDMRLNSRSWQIPSKRKWEENDQVAVAQELETAITPYEESYDT